MQESLIVNEEVFIEITSREKVSVIMKKYLLKKRQQKK